MKSKKISFYHGRVGRKAYELTKVWCLGPHIFLCDDELIFRLCYARTKKGTYYCQLSIKVCKDLGHCNG